MGKKKGFVGERAKHLEFRQVPVEHMKKLQDDGNVADWEKEGNIISLVAKKCQYHHPTGGSSPLVTADDPFNYGAIIISTPYYNYPLGLSGLTSNGEIKVL